MGNSLNVTSCVQCMDDDSAFPRPSNNSGGMCDSTSMQSLPDESEAGNQIPVTKETIDDTVQVSIMKPLGVTLCDSAMVRGVYVTAIKPEGNMAKLSQTVSVGMLLTELNGVDVTCESLESCIKKIADSPAEKRLILKFRGTAPAVTVVPSATASTTSASTTPTVTTTDSVAEKKVEDVSVAAAAEAPSVQQSKLIEASSVSVTSSVSAISQETEEPENFASKGDADEKKVEELQTQPTQKEDERGSGVSTPERTPAGAAALLVSSSDSAMSLHTVDITSPSPRRSSPVPTGHGLDFGKGDKNEDVEKDEEGRGKEEEEEEEGEFCNVSLDESIAREEAAVEEQDTEQEQAPSSENCKEESRQEEATTTTTTRDDDAGDDAELLACCQCGKERSKSSYTPNQLKKKAKRKCKGCKK